MSNVQNETSTAKFYQSSEFKALFFLIVAAIAGYVGIKATSSALSDMSNQMLTETDQVISDAINTPEAQQIKVTKRTVEEDTHGRPTVHAYTDQGVFYAVPSAEVIKDKGSLFVVYPLPLPDSVPSLASEKFAAICSRDGKCYRGMRSLKQS
ncbi:hypothetical protein [Neptuniibacter sp. QD37_11]|uniref:hypothetical protein n=1 Tax=Neptuniibacter sp. QD37_11 TaxID=3398209 RepID=UPI0039F45F3E